jgi:hypothetical protein
VGSTPFFATGVPAWPLRAPPAPAASVPTCPRGGQQAEVLAGARTARRGQLYRESAPPRSRRPRTAPRGFAGTRTGRRPLLGPSARLARALSQKMRAPSMHTPGHPGGGRRLGTKKPGGPRRGVIVGRRASGYFTTRPGGNQTRRRPGFSEAAAERACFREPPRREVRRRPPRRSSENDPLRDPGHRGAVP